MDSRKALPDGCILQLRYGHTYTILNELARGGSGIVYHAFYTDNFGQRKTVRIKECYPFRCNLKRNTDYSLSVPDSEQALFQESKDKMIKAYQIGNTFFHTDGLTNLTSNTYNIFEANNTLYVISAYTEGAELSYDTYSSVKDCIAVVRSTAIAIEKIHELGYLYLDLKPSNILTLSGTTDLIQLFDFDSVIPMSEVRNSENRFSYTKGFAALEQLNEDDEQIDVRSDVYGIGALLYYLLFNRVPDMFDCECDAVYDYTQSRLSCSNYMDSLLFTLTDFFHHTLADYIPDRYSDMHSVVQQLDELVALADETAMYVNNTVIVKPEFLIGRDEELKQFESWMNTDDVLYVCGMEGMGKSTFVRYALHVYRKCFDCIVYVSFDTDLMHTINNDFTVHVNNIHKDRSETEQEYFERKCGILRNIAETQNCLLVVDDCTDMDGSQLNMLKQCGWKIVIITSNPSIIGKHVIHMDALKQESQQVRLFENSLGRSVSEDERNDVLRIIDLLGGNTLLVELIGKQIRSPFNDLNIHNALQAIEEHGFSHISQQRIRYIKDDVIYNQTLSSLLQSLFQQGHLSLTCQAVMKALSLFGHHAVAITVVKAMLGNDGSDLTLLYQQGWIQVEENMVSLHPCIREAVRQWEYSDEALRYVRNIMSYLDTGICNESEITSTVNMYPYIFQSSLLVRKLWKEMKDAESVFETEPILESDPTENHMHLVLSISVLKSLRKENSFCHTSLYRKLLFHTLFHVPFAYQEYLYQACMDYIDLYKDENHVDLVRVYELLCDVLYDHSRIKEAEKRIDELKQIIRMDLNPSVRGKYHYLLIGYYDELLNGGYDAITVSEHAYLKGMLKEIDRAIRYLRLTKNEMLLGECYRTKALVLIRSGKGNEKEIGALLNNVSEITLRCHNPYTRLNRDTMLTKAWYDTYIIEDENRTLSHLKQAYEITMHIPHSDIDIIEDVLSPTANILFEWGKHKDASLWLLLAAAICERHCDLPAYVHKQMEMLSHLLEVCYDCDDMETCIAVMEILDEHGYTEIPQEIRTACDHYS